MNKLMVTVLTTLMLSASLSVLAGDSMNGMNMKSSADAQAVHGVGVIKSIDVKAGKITLYHQAIKELHWPAMNMGFKVANPQLLVGLKVGQHVNFELKAQGANQIISAITLVQ